MLLWWYGHVQKMGFETDDSVDAHERRKTYFVLCEGKGEVVFSGSNQMFAKICTVTLTLGEEKGNFPQLLLLKTTYVSYF